MIGRKLNTAYRGIVICLYRTIGADKISGAILSADPLRVENIAAGVDCFVGRDMALFEDNALNIVLIELLVTPNKSVGTRLSWWWHEDRADHHDLKVVQYRISIFVDVEEPG